MCDMKQNKFILTLFILFLFTSAVSADVHIPDFAKRRTMTSVRSSQNLFRKSGGYNPYRYGTPVHAVDNDGNYVMNKSVNIGQTTADLNLKPAAAPSGRSLVTSEISAPFDGGTPSRQGLIAPGRGENNRNDWRVEGPGKNPHEWSFNEGLNPWLSTPLIKATPLGDAIIPLMLMALCAVLLKCRKK